MGRWVAWCAWISAFFGVIVALGFLYPRAILVLLVARVLLGGFGFLAATLRVIDASRGPETRV